MHSPNNPLLTRVYRTPDSIPNTVNPTTLPWRYGVGAFRLHLRPGSVCLSYYYTYHPQYPSLYHLSMSLVNHADVLMQDAEALLREHQYIMRRDDRILAEDRIQWCGSSSSVSETKLTFSWQRERFQARNREETMASSGRSS